MAVIYAIYSKVNDAVYVGSSKEPTRRWKMHQKSLTSGKHHSQFLQRAWNKYGPSSFDFQILEEISSPDQLLVREQSYLDTLKLLYPRKHVYNVCWIAGCPSLGKNLTPEHIQKLSDSHKGKKPSAAAIEARRKRMEEKSVPRSFKSPEGVVYEDIRNVAKFEAEHHLKPTGLASLVSGRRKSHKGWTLPDMQMKTYSLVDPTGVAYRGIKNLPDFCREHHLNCKTIRLLVNGEVKSSHRGWRLMLEDGTVSVPPQKKGFFFVSPLGEVHGPVWDVSEFSRKQGLPPWRTLSSVACGKVKSYRGWTLYQEKTSVVDFEQTSKGK